MQFIYRDKNPGDFKMYPLEINVDYIIIKNQFVL